MFNKTHDCRVPGYPPESPGRVLGSNLGGYLRTLLLMHCLMHCLHAVIQLFTLQRWLKTDCCCIGIDMSASLHNQSCTYMYLCKQARVRSLTFVSVQWRTYWTCSYAAFNVTRSCSRQSANHCTIMMNVRTIYMQTPKCQIVTVDQIGNLQLKMFGVYVYMYIYTRRWRRV